MKPSISEKIKVSTDEQLIKLGTLNWLLHSRLKAQIQYMEETLELYCEAFLNGLKCNKKNSNSRSKAPL